MRPLAFILLLALSAQTAHAAEPPSAPTWPLWDGSETVEQYAKRVGLEPNKTLDLGKGVKLEMVLIPAGKFIMGTPEPTPVDEEVYLTRIWFGQFALAISVGVVLVLLGTVVIRAIRQRRRPQYSLARFVAMIVVAGVGVLGGIHWRESARALAEAKAEYHAALTRFEDSDVWERPAHEVRISKPYYLGRFEVTQEQYQQVLGVNRSQFKGPDLPVDTVSWNRTQQFCKKASEKTGVIVRLPTEAEWEYACRAGTRTTYYTGDAEADLDRAAWYEENSGNTTHPVGQKAPNAWGLFDMHGNVWERCADWLGAYGAGSATDPQGPEQGRERVLRGGSWRTWRRNCRSVDRCRFEREFLIDCPGFRVAVEVAPKAP